MANGSSVPSIEMSRRAFLFVGSAATAAGWISLSSPRAHAAATSSVATADEEPSARPHRTLLGLL